VLEIPQEIRKENYSEGKDVASVLGITKYEPPERPCGVKGGGQVTKKKSNPLFDKYTDIQNIKHFPDLFKEGEDIVITEKIHGSNFRAGLLPRPNRSILAWFLNLFNKYEFVYGSHMVQKKPLSLHKGYYKEDIWLEMVHKYNLDKIIPKDYIVYGEVYGCGVQDLVYDCPNEHNLMIFDIKYKGKYLDWDKVKLFCTHFQLPIVPTLLECRYTYDTVKLCTDGKSVVCPTQIREGCIVKPAVEVEIAEYNGRAFGRKILKSVSVDYLTRKEGTEYH
jgi:RNA ligase (TIGR02306 family)